jgi:DUF1680 family protein
VAWRLPSELVDVVRRFADLLVEQIGVAAGPDGFDGHPEVETALVELYRVTGHRPYPDLAGRLIGLRGRGLLDDDCFGPADLHDHVRVRDREEVAGHTVRQLYLLAGVVDVAVETYDEELLAASRRLWDDAFGDPQEQLADRTYGETGAAIASVQWNWRMLLATGESRYADEMERALYNAVAVATSLDGTHFFCGRDCSDADVPSQRLPWDSCACCPPNLARLVASLHGYTTTTDRDGVQVHLYSAGAVRTEVDGIEVEIITRTDYPWHGRVELTVTASGPVTLSLRVPDWCDSTWVCESTGHRSTLCSRTGT